MAVSNFQNSFGARCMHSCESCSSHRKAIGDCNFKRGVKLTFWVVELTGLDLCFTSASSASFTKRIVGTTDTAAETQIGFGDYGVETKGFGNLDQNRARE